MDHMEYLEQVKNKMRTIKKKREKLQEMRWRALSVPGGVRLESRGGRELQKMERLVCDMREAEEEQIIEESKACLIKADMLEMLCGLQDSNEFQVLVLRYIYLKPWEEISGEMNKTRRYLHTIHSRALASFQQLYETGESQEKGSQPLHEKG